MDFFYTIVVLVLIVWVVNRGQQENRRFARSAYAPFGKRNRRYSVRSGGYKGAPSSPGTPYAPDPEDARQWAEDLAAVSRTSYASKRILGWEEAHILYKLESWVRARGLGERVFPQVPMGTYLDTPDTAALALIRYKRPDYVIVNRTGMPVCVVEYQGSGHYQGDAAIRDSLKKAALDRANIPLIEIFHDEKNDAARVHEKLNAAVVAASVDGS